MFWRCSWDVTSIDGGVELSIDDGSEPEDIVDDTEDADGKDTPEELLDVEDDDDDVALVQPHILEDDAMDSADDKEAASEEDMLILLEIAVEMPIIGLLPSWLPIRWRWWGRTPVEERLSRVKLLLATALWAATAVLVLAGVDIWRWVAVDDGCWTDVNVNWFAGDATIQGWFWISSRSMRSEGRSRRQLRIKSWHSSVRARDLWNLTSAPHICSSCSNGISPHTMSYKRIPRLQTVAGAPWYRLHLIHSGGAYTRVPKNEINITLVN